MTILRGRSDFLLCYELLICLFSSLCTLKCSLQLLFHARFVG